MFEIANFSRKSGRRASFVIFEIVPRPHNFGGILRGWCDLLLCKLFFCCINFINKNFYIFLEFFNFLCMRKFLSRQCVDVFYCEILVFVKK